MINSVVRRSFFFFFSLYASSCAMPQVQSDFYRGLLSKEKHGGGSETVRLFERSLSSSNEYVRQAAAEEIANLMVEGAEISPFTTGRVRSEARGVWAAAFEAVDPSPNKEKVLEFLLTFERGADFPNEARLYVLNECNKQEYFFSDIELAAIQGHFLITQQRYSEALIFFRMFQEDGAWQAQIPELFLKYPGLINDLGRAFQYTSSSVEGLVLFSQWEKNAPHNLSDDARYGLLFFSARIARRAGQSSQAVALFEHALAFAPDAGQSDACVWYILDSSLRADASLFIQALERFVPLWHDGRYFDDIMERFLQELVSRRNWERIIRVYGVIKEQGGALAKAGYAWVIARLMTEGFLSSDETQLAADTSETAEAYFQFAYNGGLRYELSPLYYRWQSAAVLEQPFLEIAPSNERGEKPSPALQFLLGFFQHDAAKYAPAFISRMENELSPNELRSLAEALQKAEMYQQSLRLISLYINKEDYVQNRRDLELMFPRPYKELVERYAKEFNMEPSFLFALIRTESAFQSAIVSHAGAVGLTQLMPATAREMAERIRRSGGPDYTGGGLDLTDPALNIHIGAYYFNYLMGRFDNKLISLFAYNGGMNRVRRWVSANTLPEDLFLETISIYETRDYGRKVLAASAVYEELYYRR